MCTLTRLHLPVAAPSAVCRQVLHMHTGRVQTVGFSLGEPWVLAAACVMQRAGRGRRALGASGGAGGRWRAGGQAHGARAGRARGVAGACGVPSVVHTDLAQTLRTTNCHACCLTVLVQRNVLLNNQQHQRKMLVHCTILLPQRQCTTSASHWCAVLPTAVKWAACPPKAAPWPAGIAGEPTYANKCSRLTGT
jgi:hypothetical protein